VSTSQNKIDRLQRIIILHSYIYYHLDDNVLTDFEYDSKAHRLAAYKQEYPELWKSSKYYEQFGDDYDGSTGFGLYDRLDPEQQKIIRHIAKYRHEKEKQ